MSIVEKIESEDKKRYVVICKSSDDTFVLKEYLVKYDTEEDAFYEVQSLPGPDGRFGNLEAAISEAERLLNLI